MIGQITSASHSSYGADFYKHRNREEKQGLELEKQDEKKAKELQKEKLTPAEKEQVRELKLRDAEVRTHEQAHMAAAGSLAMGGPSYVFQTGPDGVNYAVGGSVKIDTSPGNTAKETIRKAAQMKAAALAPADPSGQDIKVAAAASSLVSDAQIKIAKEEGKDEHGRANTEKDPFDSSISNSRQLLPSGEVDSGNEGSDQQKEGNGKAYANLIAEKYGKPAKDSEHPSFAAVA